MGDSHNTLCINSIISVHAPGIVFTLSLIVCLRLSFGPWIGRLSDSQCIVTDACSNVCTLFVTRLASFELSTPGRAKTRSREGALPGDNPIYDGGDSTISLAGIPRTVHYENIPSNEPRGRSFSNREFDNPIYGRDGTGTGESLYAYPDDPQSLMGVPGQSVLPYHEFDNPIYGREGIENTYSEVHEPAVANGVATTTTESIRTCSDHDYDHPW